MKQIKNPLDIMVEYGLLLEEKKKKKQYINIVLIYLKV